MRVFGDVHFNPTPTEQVYLKCAVKLFPSLRTTKIVTAYIDDAGIIWKGKARFHLAADSVAELHMFAKSIDVNRCWFHVGAKRPHYDVTAEQRARAILNGAIAVSSRELVRIIASRVPSSSQ
ncbi:DUF4031 domain-containing protein [Burkholderia cenocepacia]|uniref:DUF4031 domain-containing protein n=1 Tax=Burkholderia cenocepacia TaxID=95486 RepID=UPI002A912304|nr:DUF4031 domain-containing protein [Burkholderia cenocepacia]